MHINSFFIAKKLPLYRFQSPDQYQVKDTKILHRTEFSYLSFEIGFTTKFFVFV